MKGKDLFYMSGVKRADSGRAAEYTILYRETRPIANKLQRLAPVLRDHLRPLPLIPLLIAER
jgi:hypothetical protein